MIPGWQFHQSKCTEQTAHNSGTNAIPSEASWESAPGSKRANILAPCSLQFRQKLWSNLSSVRKRIRAMLLLNVESRCESIFGAFGVAKYQRNLNKSTSCIYRNGEVELRNKITKDLSDWNTISLGRRYLKLIQETTSSQWSISCSIRTRGSP